MSKPFPKFKEGALFAALAKAYGGTNEFFEELEAEVAIFNAHWEHDATMIGSVLHAHMVVDYFLLRVIQYQHGSLPDLAGARLKFDQKLKMLKPAPIIDDLMPGLRKLNTIRNELAHTMHLSIDPEDVKAMRACKLYSGFKSAGVGVPQEAAEVVLDFSRFAASMLNNMANPKIEQFGAAVAKLFEDSETEP